MMNTQTVFVEISSIANPITDDLLRLVSDEKRERVKKFKFDIDRKLSLYSELMVRYQVCKALNILNKDIVFGKNDNGKPFLLYQPEFRFNISHTRNAIAAAFSDSEIGVDIESIKPADVSIANRFFTSSEQSYISSHNNPDYAFYEVWTKKEAYIKFLGTGLSTPLNSFNVLDDSLKKMMNTVSIEQYIISFCCNSPIDSDSNISTMKEDKLHLLFNQII